MYNLHTLNQISPTGLSQLGDGFTLDPQLPPDGLLVRSASLHDMEFPSGLLAVARAGAGVNNIPLERCSAQGIVVFNTPGANANAVKELVLGGLVLAGRRVAQGAAWVKANASRPDLSKLVEKSKSSFAGPELAGKTLGVIGLGAIGAKVANLAAALGMQVLGYDPYLSVDAAWGLDRTVRHALTLEEIYSQSDFITLHLPVCASTRGMIDAKALSAMKPGVRLLNFARGKLVCEDALLDALSRGAVACYVCDFPSPALLACDACVCLPHLGASTPESEDSCAAMAAQQLRDYLLDGTIRNSVNFPDASLPRSGQGSRICVVHRNIPGMLARITDAASSARLNIENMVNKSRGDHAYTILDAGSAADDSVRLALQALDGVLRVRLI